MADGVIPTTENFGGTFDVRFEKLRVIACSVDWNLDLEAIKMPDFFCYNMSINAFKRWECLRLNL